MKRALVVVATLVLGVSLAPTTSAASAAAFPIVYMSVRAGDGGLYMLSGVTSMVIKGARSNGHDCGPAMRPPATPRDRTRGSLLAFESNRVTDPYSPTNFEIYVVNLRTNKLKRLTNHGGLDGFPTWSPDGRRIAFSRDDVPLWFSPTTSLWVMQADGSRQRQLTQAAPGTSHLFPAWSPDGTKIAFTLTTPATSAIYTVDADGRNLRMLADDAEYPAWSPDGKWIVFDSDRDQAPYETDIYVMRSDGSHLQRVAVRAGSDVMPSWSPDGRHIAYVHDDDYWTAQGVLAVFPSVSPVQATEIYVSGQAPSRIWELTLDRSRHAVSDRRLSSGDHDLFPHYSPVRNPM
jgi:Tol biopolymer transport system component